MVIKFRPAENSGKSDVIALATATKPVDGAVAASPVAVPVEIEETVDMEEPVDMEDRPRW